MSEELESNPYSAPSMQDIAISTEVASAFFLKTRVVQSAWALAVLINLPIPVMFGSDVARGELRIGMVIGVLAVYGVGAWCCTMRPSVMWRLIVGSGLTALSQFFPVLHLVVGTIAMGISRFVFSELNPAGETLTRLSQVIASTILTGVGLILPSIIFGLVGIAIFRIRAFDPPQPSSLKTNPLPPDAGP